MLTANGHVYSRELKSKGERHVFSRLSKRKDKKAVKIIIAGSGKVGQTLARELLDEGYDITLIDSDSSVLQNSLESIDVMAYGGNCASMETLLGAGVKDADLLIATAATDEINLLCCMTAHAINPKIHAIARIRDPEYLRQAYAMKESFGLSLAINPEKQAAAEIERLIKYPGFLKRDAFARGKAQIVELKIEEGSTLCDVPLNAMNGIVKCKVLVCAVLREGKAIVPDGSFVLKAGDKIFVTAPTDSLSDLLKNLGIVTHKIKNVMIAGGGMICYYLAKLLEKSKLSVSVIDKSQEKCERLSELLPKVSVIHGDASNQQTLASVGIDETDALISLTGNDELNMIISLYGNSCGVSLTVTGLSEFDNTGITDTLPIGSVIRPHMLCCNTVVRYVRALEKQSGAAITVHSIANGQMEAMEFNVEKDTLNSGVPLKKIKLRKNILIACITRGDVTEIPSGDSVFNEGDSVVIVSSGDAPVLQLNDIFE